MKGFSRNELFLVGQSLAFYVTKNHVILRVRPTSYIGVGSQLRSQPILRWAIC